MTGNGAIPEELLSRNWSSVYVHPERTSNALDFLNLTHSFTGDLRLSGNLYYRRLNQGIYAADVEVEYDDEDVEYEGDPTISQASTLTSGYGGTLQLAYLGKLVGFENYAVVGFNYVHGDTDFSQFAQPGQLTGNREINPDGPNTQLTDLNTKNTYYGLYFTDTFSPKPRLHFTGAGRWNKAEVDLNGWGTDPEDGDRTDLKGSHSFWRFNPAAGFTLQPLTALRVKSPLDDLTLFANYSEGRT